MDNNMQQSEKLINGELLVYQQQEAADITAERQLRKELPTSRKEEAKTAKDGKRFQMSLGVLSIAQTSGMSSLDKKAAEDKDKKDDIVQYTYVPLQGFFINDKRTTLSPQRFLVLAGLCRTLKQLEKDNNYLEYKKNLEMSLWADKSHEVVNDANKIKMELTKFSKIAFGENRGGATRYKKMAHHGLQFFNSAYGRYLTNDVVRNKGFKEARYVKYEPLIKYSYEIEENENDKDVLPEYIEITFHDVFILQNFYVSFPDALADLLENLDRMPDMFYPLLLDVALTRGKKITPLKAAIADKRKELKAAGIKEKKEIARQINIAKNDVLLYERKQSTILKDLLLIKDTKSRYHRSDGTFRRSDWKTDLLKCINALIKIKLIKNKEAAKCIYEDSEGGCGCRFIINERW